MGRTVKTPQALEKAASEGLSLRYYRIRCGLSLDRLAILSGVHRNTISRYEQGLTSPSLETAQKLCKALGVSMDDVFGE